jgi:hypothetical protein
MYVRYERYVREWEGNESNSSICDKERLRGHPISMNKNLEREGGNWFRNEML